MKENARIQLNELDQNVMKGGVKESEEVKKKKSMNMEENGKRGEKIGNAE